ncbi:MAG: hypothetical protein IPN73_01390 [Saprospiraceae bacterium]|nr:hypothetical protein [Saprospiraceae bacterium]MBK8111441.1 hypothetical protein [Saprospiraceae bacterium]MBK8848790.1 hypothetical protein [Saprospiraceae bacterium]
MKATKIFPALIGILLLVSGVFAQTKPSTFFIVETMKTKPGMSDEYVKSEMEVWKKVHQERQKLGKIAGWTLYQVRYPAGTSTAYDYVTVTSVNGWAGIGEFYTGWDFEKIGKGLTKEQMAIVNKTETLRDLTTHQVYFGEDFISAPNLGTVIPTYLWVNYFKVPSNHWSEYYDMETKLVKPVHIETMASGKGKSAWGFYSRVMPYDPSTYPDNAVTIDFFNKWEDMDANIDYQAALKKVHPGMSEEYYGRQIEEARTMLKAELWVRLDGI